MRTIVAPVNFSPASDNAARYAADIAAYTGSTLHLVHVMQMPFVANEYPIPDGAFEALRDSSSAQLKTLAAELSNRTGQRVPVEIHIEIGGVEYKVRKFCEEVQPFLVVMGAAGLPLDRFLNGSPTLQALRHLPSVLIVPNEARFRRPERIVLACDLEDINSGLIGARGFIRELKDLFGAQFDVINVMTPAEGQEQSAYTFEAWRTKMREIHPELHFLHTRSVTGGIDEYMNHHSADWLIVFPKKHAFLELHNSMAKKIVLHSPLPVLSIHE